MYHPDDGRLKAAFELAASSRDPRVREGVGAVYIRLFGGEQTARVGDAEIGDAAAWAAASARNAGRSERRREARDRERLGEFEGGPRERGRRKVGRDLLRLRALPANPLEPLDPRDPADQLIAKECGDWRLRDELMRLAQDAVLRAISNDDHRKIYLDSFSGKVRRREAAEAMKLSGPDALYNRLSRAVQRVRLLLVDLARKRARELPPEAGEILMDYVTRHLVTPAERRQTRHDAAAKKRKRPSSDKARPSS